MAGFEFIALALHQVAPGKWQRYVIRHCRCCKHVKIDAASHVDMRYYLCEHCWSHDVKPAPGMDPPAIVCNECLRVTLLDDPPEQGLLESGDAAAAEEPPTRWVDPPPAPEDRREEDDEDEDDQFRPDV